MPIRAVWFDVGEALIDETREYGTWADWLGVPRHTFSAVFGAVLARGGDYREVFQYFKPGFDLAVERERRFEAGLGEYLNANDLYPDVRPCFDALHARGLFVGVAGNQTVRAGQFLRELHLNVDVLATSDDWGVSKPDDAFFEKLISVSGHDPSEIAYVGDRRDNDIAPAARAGLYTILVRRGPWGFILAEGDFLPSPDVVVGGLSEIPDFLGH
ncbi:HAD family hydrolase [Actinomycetospora sp. TBRC 11914]|uniref:HAD family hydrolase n=1 Tax=Actinomycetospora sp. TBRC 11914 TaxID=2729387 RepID=UPI00145F033D|nr:HAD-IA family hydrolase [Actinomycetospora sp. TBRC 11914]NMO93123.1 HAD family hydrolase [Actinomycetospora sp. TBRC 11914]